MTQTSKEFLAVVGKPKLIQSDNGTKFTYRYVSEFNPLCKKKESKQSGFEFLLQENDMKHYLMRPRTPQQNVNMERFNQTVLKEFSARVLKWFAFG